MHLSIYRKILSAFVVAVIILAAVSGVFAEERKVYFDVDGIT